MAATEQNPNLTLALPAAGTGSDKAPRERRRPRVHAGHAAAIATWAALVGGWWLAARFEWVSAALLPSPEAVLRKLVTLSTEGFDDATLGQHLFASLSRMAAAFALAIATAIPVGILIATNRIVRGVVDPIVEFYRPIPPLAYLPLMVVWFGIGDTSKILLIYLTMFAPLTIATAAGANGVSASRLRAAASLGATRFKLLRHVVLPSALPDILTGVRIALGAGWSTLVAAELIAATRGLGFMVYSASRFLVTDVVVAGILVIGAIALALEIGLRALQRRLTPWRAE
ncbi:ABC transporter permease subunit [Burkholderia oklahomensis]|uniref:ABC transporter permease subunit n=1 Tax=Burkholderia oklahomensis TaxID=342113 RepID=UPI00016A947B|nr:ABC transporter permease subunit [Burkholderia oklahomensis]AJX35465.1 binding--dependent transport system inner membrane component family protein [Burkholderia oklahomensis C6786]AOI48643.1 taurine ABC transporter permease [Burkholderia oklahomensis C6786]KUY47429.1 taurine ABC transporter permease [Burkholderia oklahomensis C6786]MBI0363175.1 ABC transporter permease subunit [Burkholderia oklahomensis]